MKGSLLVISAPSGAGKTSLVAKCLEELDNTMVSVSHTTRAPRPGETDGINYHFVSTEDFLEMSKNGDFLESAEVFGNHYGTSEKVVREKLEQGTNVILEIDWQGAQQIRRQFEDLVSIFILPPSLEILRERLTKRGQDNEETIAGRLAEASNEMSHYLEYDYILINDEFDQCAENLKSVIIGLGLRSKNQSKKHAELLSALLNQKP